MRGKKYKKQPSQEEPEYEEDNNEDSNTPFALAGLYVLKVLLIDMTISLGDVGTDFWQVSEFIFICIKIVVFFFNVTAISILPRE